MGKSHFVTLGLDPRVHDVFRVTWICEIDQHRLFEAQYGYSGQARV